MLRQIGRGAAALARSVSAAPSGAVLVEGSAAMTAALRLVSARTFAMGAPGAGIPPLFKPAGLPPTIANIKVEPRQMAPDSRRTGLIAVKAGMTQEWDEHGVRIPLTVLWVDDCQVVQVKHSARDNTTSLQVGAGSKKPKQLSPGLRGHFEKATVPPKRKLMEFRVTDDALMPPGTEIGAAHFKAGQKVDVTGTTIGKGFQGAMKLHGFKGQPASHGNSLAHRKPGAIGGCQDPGKVFKGKRMPGRMGNRQRTVANVVVHRVDPERNLIYLRGQVPGHSGNFLRVCDAVRAPFSQRADLPFPTFAGDNLPPVMTAPAPKNMYQVHYSGR